MYLCPNSCRYVRMEWGVRSSVYIICLSSQVHLVVKKDIIKKFRTSEKTFTEVPEDEREFLQLFSFICLLSYDVYVKKLLIEKIIDGMAEEKKEKETKEKEKK